MDWLKNLPRWALTIGFVVVLGISGWSVKYIVAGEHGQVVANAAEILSIKSIAYQAKRTAEDAQMSTAELRGAIQDIQNKNETFRREYREDQQRMFDKLEMISKKQ